MSPSETLARHMKEELPYEMQNCNYFIILDFPLPLVVGLLFMLVTTEVKSAYRSLKECMLTGLKNGLYQQ
jgi:hypothetical protein